MNAVLTAEDVRRQDAEAASRGIPVPQLMENAGWAVARVARRVLGGTYGRRVVIVCGKGNNAGDGLVAGRVLRAHGAHCTAILTSPAGALNELASAQLARFGGRVAHLDELSRELERADLVIDAIFGVGLGRAPALEQAEAIKECNAARIARGSSLRVLAVDVPSGVVADTGAIPGEAVRADVTVTLGGYKPGLLFMPGAACAGTVEVATIGTDASGASMHALEAGDVRELLPVREVDAHKRNVGTVLVVAGSLAMPGAAALTTGAAVNAGAGLTVLCAPEQVCRIVVERVPEITTIPIPASSEGTIDIKALDLLAHRFDEFDAIAIGPGLTTHPAASELARAVVAAASCPLVVDADGLNAFAGAAEHLRDASGVIITPHAGELSRLLGVDKGEISRDRVAAARRAAEQLDAIVLLKGPGSVITDGRRSWVNTTGGASLAQGGTGDVLTGIVAALVAQSRVAEPEGSTRRRRDDATMTAVAAWLHGAAADRIAARIAPHPANASALIDELGPTMHAVMAGA